MATTPYIYSQKIPTITTQNSIPAITSNIPCFIICTKQSRKSVLIVRNSSSEAAATSIGANETSPVELPPGSPSIISALNVEKAILGIAITDIDHYGRLGLSRKCSYAEVHTFLSTPIFQVPVAYKKKVEEVMNDRFVEEELNKKLEHLKESYSILSTPEERRLYDWSLVRSETQDNYKWPFEVDKAPQSTGIPPPQEPEDEEPTILMGYFFLGWFVLAAVLSIAFNL